MLSQLFTVGATCEGHLPPGCGLAGLAEAEITAIITTATDQCAKIVSIVFGG